MNIAFIPVRSGSKSIPLKNIKELCGKPLVFWVLQAFHKAKSIDKIYVATDGKEIKEVVNGFNFDRVEVYDRDPINDIDTASTESVMLEFLSKIKFSNDDNFILAQATSPFTKSQNIEEALKVYTESEADSLLTCARIKRFLWSSDGKPFNYDYMSRPRRQDFEGVLVENGAFYIQNVGGVLKNKNRLGGKIFVYEMPEYTITELDEPDDWVIAEKIMRKHVLKEG